MQEIFYKLKINSQAGVLITHQIVQQITWLIASGQLKKGDRLPPIRDLADYLSINLHTVRKAYLALKASGLVEIRQGRGTHVLSYDLQRITHSAIAIHSHTVGVILPNISNPFYHGVLHGVEQVADPERVLLFVCNTDDDPDKALRYVAQLTARQVDGILIVSHDLANLNQMDVKTPPLPTVNIDWPGSTGYSVEIDLENAAYLATRHLIEHGHQQVGILTFFPEVANVRPLNLGYQRALQEANLALDPDLIIGLGDFKFPSGVEGMQRLLSLSHPPTAVFAIADILALGAMRAVTETGLRIPQDIALIGFNDIPVASLVQPSLTTVNVNAAQAGYQAMSMLQKLIAGKRPAKRRILIPTDLVIRQSCGCLKGG